MISTAATLSRRFFFATMSRRRCRHYASHCRFHFDTLVSHIFMMRR